MQYFTQDFISFFKELTKNNHREWFHEHKKDYENHVKKPFYQLVGDVISLLKEKHDPHLELEVKNAVFRINRDIRFSKDKSPYKTHVAAVISRGGRKDLMDPGIYLHLSNGVVNIGGGCYQPDKKTLHNIRTAILKNPKAVDKILKQKNFKKTYGELKGEKNKRLPKEFAPHQEAIPLLLNKQFYFMSAYDPKEVLFREDLPEFILEHYTVAKPWNQFLKNAMQA